MTNYTGPLQQPVGCPPPALTRVKPLEEGQPATQVWGTLLPHLQHQTLLFGVITVTFKLFLFN